MTTERAIRFEASDAFLASTIFAARQRSPRPLLVGLSGAQGSGKSSTARRVASLLQEAGLAVVVCSLDDFYLTKSERRALASAIHPLLATRGVPGTHDTRLADRLFTALLDADSTSRIALPQFDKLRDDRISSDAWRHHVGSTDVVIFEGWCVGAGAVPHASLNVPLNALERDEDDKGIWRRFVNQRLAEDYAALFARLDYAIMLRAPSCDCIFAWRAEQEDELSRTADRQGMNGPELARFIAHFERITRSMLEEEPADLIVDLATDRSPVAWRWRDGADAAAG